MIDSEVLLPRVQKAAEINQDRCIRFTKKLDMNQFQFYKGKWLAYAEIALYLEGKLDEEITDLGMGIK